MTEINPAANDFSLPSGLRGQLFRALDAVWPLRADGLLSITLEMPGEMPALLCHEAPRPCFYWQRPDAGQRIIGLGCAVRHETQGEDRFASLQERWRALESGWVRLGVANPVSALLGYAFDADDSPQSGLWRDLPNAVLWVPEILLEQRGTHHLMTLTARLQGQSRTDMLDRWLALLDTEPVPTVAEGQASHALVDSLADWTTLMQEAQAAIAGHELDKLVIARGFHVHLPRRVDVAALMDRMQSRYPGCTLMAISLQTDWLVAATPERLLSLHDGVVRCDAIAGTLAGAAEVQGFSARVRQLEHLPVVQHIRAALEGGCHSVRETNSMDTLKLPHLRHLCTRLEGQLLPGQDLFGLLARLHPTPAINGFPASAALAWLRRHDNHRRGWYGGGAGWIRADGEGDVSVLLRCALLQDRDAWLFAGAGIVDGADIKAEWKETELKLDSMRGCLNACR